MKLRRHFHTTSTAHTQQWSQDCMFLQLAKPEHRVKYNIRKTIARTLVPVQASCLYSSASCLLPDLCLKLQNNLVIGTSFLQKWTCAPRHISIPFTLFWSCCHSCFFPHIALFCLWLISEQLHHNIHTWQTSVHPSLEAPHPSTAICI